MILIVCDVIVCIWSDVPWCLTRARMICAAIVCAHIAYVSDCLRSDCLYSGCLRFDLACPDCVCSDDHALIAVLVLPAL